MKAPVAIIGGSGVKSLVSGEQRVIGTPYGPTAQLIRGEVKGRPVVFLARHGEGHTAPPHRVNYRANLWGLKALGTVRVIATNAVGAIDPELSSGDFVVPADLVDLTKSRRGTFYESKPVTHIDVSEPYCPTIRKSLVSAAMEFGRKADREVVMACTEGPRYETPAEIRMLRTIGCGIVGMTGAPEAFLARELELCYAPICLVSNMAAGLQRKLSATEVEEIGRDSGQILNKIIIHAVENMPESRKSCSCAKALASAQLATKEKAEIA